MDIAGVVKYENVHELNITYPNSDKKIGLTMGIRSASSEACKATMRRHTNDQFNQRGRQKKLTAEVAEQNELENTAASIAWWKWGNGDDGQPCNYQGKQPELSMGIAIEILGKVNWIYAQTKECATNVENFMPTAANGAANGSDNLSSSTVIKTIPAGPNVSVT